MKKNLKVKNIFLVFLLILAVGFVAVAYYYSQMAPATINESNEPVEENKIIDEEEPSTTEEVALNTTPTLTPTPKPIPHGKRSFVVSLPPNTKGPKIGKGTIDPYDPAIQGQQTLIIEVNDTVPVTSVVATLKTDNKTVEYALTPTTPNQSKGNWTGTWTVDDSYLYTYILSVKATSTNGTTAADLTTR